MDICQKRELEESFLIDKEIFVTKNTIINNISIQCLYNLIPLRQQKLSPFFMISRMWKSVQCGKTRRGEGVFWGPAVGGNGEKGER